jgi:predicted transcriptional regulator
MPDGLTDPPEYPTIDPTVSARTGRPHALAETATAYGASTPAPAHTKLSITLPTELVEQVRAAAEATGASVSGVIAAAIRSAIARADQDRIDAALDAQNEENLAWSRALLPSTARIWSEIEW